MDWLVVGRKSVFMSGSQRRQTAIIFETIIAARHEIVAIIRQLSLAMRLLQMPDICPRAVPEILLRVAVVGNVHCQEQPKPGEKISKVAIGREQIFSISRNWLQLMATGFGQTIVSNWPREEKAFWGEVLVLVADAATADDLPPKTQR